MTGRKAPSTRGGDRGRGSRYSGGRGSGSQGISSRGSRTDDGREHNLPFHEHGSDREVSTEGDNVVGGGASSGADTEVGGASRSGVGGPSGSGTGGSSRSSGSGTGGSSRSGTIAASGSGSDSATAPGRRGYSRGIFLCIPARPNVIRMARNVIDNGTAKRTLLSIMRAHWPDDCFNVHDVDKNNPHWWNKMLDEFFLYYTYDPAHGTLEDAGASVLYHMRDNFRKFLYRELERTKKKVAEIGGSFEDHRPDYYLPSVWDKLCIHWRTQKFNDKSVAATGCRQQLKLPHHSGACSYDLRARELEKKLGRTPSRLDVFLDTHQPKKKDATDPDPDLLPQVKDIQDRYLKICEENNVDPSDRSLERWAETVGIRKGYITGVPRFKASEILGCSRSQARAPRRRGEDHVGRSTVSRLEDDIFMHAVDRTVAFATEHPQQFDLTPEQVQLLVHEIAQDVQDASELPADHPLSQETMRELIHVILTVLNDILSRESTRKRKGKEVVRDEGGKKRPPSPRPPRGGGGGIVIRD